MAHPYQTPLLRSNETDCRYTQQLVSPGILLSLKKKKFQKVSCCLIPLKVHSRKGKTTQKTSQ